MIDWDDLRYFLSLARNAALTSAAADLKVASSTIGRRLAALEKTIGVRLLDRTPEGYVATSAGEEVRAKAESIEAAVLHLERKLGNRDREDHGRVRVGCAESIANHLLAPALPAFHSVHPNIVVELVPDPGTLSLSMREADISVRLRRPVQQDVVTRCIGRLEFGLYASRDYLAERGPCDLREGCSGHTSIAQNGDVQHDEQHDWFSALCPHARQVAHVASHEAAVAVAVAGGGLACLAAFRAKREPELVLIDTPQPAPSIDLWIVLHKDNRQIARFRAVIDHTASALHRLDNGVLRPDHGSNSPKNANADASA